MAIDLSWQYSFGDTHRKLPHFPGSARGRLAKEGTQAHDLFLALQKKSFTEETDAHDDMWLSLPSIIRLGIAKYGTVITDLRNMGYTILCRTKLVRKRGKMIRVSEFAMPYWRDQLDAYRSVLKHHASNRR